MWIKEKKRKEGTKETRHFESERCGWAWERVFNHPFDIGRCKPRTTAGTPHGDKLSQQQRTLAAAAITALAMSTNQWFIHHFYPIPLCCRVLWLVTDVTNCVFDQNIKIMVSKLCCWGLRPPSWHRWQRYLRWLTGQCVSAEEEEEEAKALLLCSWFRIFAALKRVTGGRRKIRTLDFSRYTALCLLRRCFSHPSHFVSFGLSTWSIGYGSLETPFPDTYRIGKWQGKPLSTMVCLICFHRLFSSLSFNFFFHFCTHCDWGLCSGLCKWVLALQYVTSVVKHSLFISPSLM